MYSYFQHTDLFTNCCITIFDQQLRNIEPCACGQLAHVGHGVVPLNVPVTVTSRVHHNAEQEDQEELPQLNTTP